MNESEVFKFLASCADVDVLRRIALVADARKAEVARYVVRNKIGVGGLASFVDKYGVKHVGTVLKVNAKTVHLQVGRTKWRVTPSLLFPVEKAA